MCSTYNSLVEIVSYDARVCCRYNPTGTVPYAIYALLVLLAPILIAASIYMYLGRIIFAVRGEQHCIIPARFLTKIFVSGDVICFLIQAAGGGILSNADNDSGTRLGQHIILGGLIFQVIIFVIFVFVAANFHVRMTRATSVNGSSTGQLPWQQLLWGLYAVSSLITLRNIFRCIECGMGSTGYLLKHEWISFVFDGAAMTIVLIICLSWYFSGVASRRKISNVESASDSELKTTEHQPETEHLDRDWFFLYRL